MIKILCFASCLLLFLTGLSYPGQSDTQIIDNVMRDIVIGYVINDDRKLPKKNRQKWEEGFSESVDFKSLNNAMRKSIKRALETYLEGPIDEDKTRYIGEKAIAFYLPKILFNTAVGHLKIQHRIGDLPKCHDNQAPTAEEKVIVCTERSNDTINAYWVSMDRKRPYHYSFRKTDKWRLSELYTPIDEGTLTMIGMWK